MLKSSIVVARVVSRGTCRIAQPPGFRTRSNSRIAAASFGICSSTWLHKIASKQLSGKASRVISVWTLTLGAQRSAVT